MGAVSQSRLTLCNPMDCRPPGSSVHGILQARTLEWVAISSFKWSSQLRDCKACLRHCRWILYYWTTGGCPWSLARGSSLKQKLMHTLGTNGTNWRSQRQEEASEHEASTILDHQGGFVEKRSFIWVSQKLSESRYLKDGKTYSGDLELIDIWLLKWNYLLPHLKNNLRIIPSVLLLFHC